GALLLHLLAEMLLEGAQDAERRGQVDVEDGVPLLVAHLLDNRVPGVAGVVHNHMAAAEGVDRGLDDAVAEVGLGDVAVAGHCLAAHLLDLGDGLLGRRLVYVVDHHLRAIAHQAQRDLAADASARAGDDSHPPIQLTHCPSSICLTLRSARRARLEGSATSKLLPTLRDATLCVAPQGEAFRSSLSSLRRWHGPAACPGRSGWCT